MAGKYPTHLELARKAEAEGSAFEAKPHYEAALREDPGCREAGFFLTCYEAAAAPAQNVISLAGEVRDAFDAAAAALEGDPERPVMLRAMTLRISELAGIWLRSVDFSEEHFSSTVAKDREDMRLVSDRRRAACMDLMRHTEESLAALPDAGDILHGVRKAVLRLLAEHPRALPAAEMRKETRRLTPLVNAAEPGAAPEVALPSPLSRLKQPVMGVLFGLNALLFLLNFAVNWGQSGYAVTQGAAVIFFDLMFFFAVRKADSENKPHALSCATIFLAVQAGLLVMLNLTRGGSGFSPTARGAACLPEAVIGVLLVLYVWKGPFRKPWLPVLMAVFAVGFLVFNITTWTQSLAAFDSGMHTFRDSVGTEERQTRRGILYRLTPDGEVTPLTQEMLDAITARTEPAGMLLTYDAQGEIRLCGIVAGQTAGAETAGLQNAATEVWVQTTPLNDYVDIQRRSFLLSTASVFAFDLACAVGFLSPFARKRRGA